MLHTTQCYDVETVGSCMVPYNDHAGTEKRYIQL